MAKVLWFCWCGGGNLPPSLGVAEAMGRRGHQVIFAGRPEMLSRVNAAGFSTIELTDAYREIDAYAVKNFMRGILCYLTSSLVAKQVQAIAESVTPDIVVIDAMFVAALSVASSFPCPAVVMYHTLFYRALPAWKSQMQHQNELLIQAHAILPDIEKQWFQREGIIVTTLPELDLPAQVRLAGVPRERVHHVGPVFYDEKRAIPMDVPWPENDPTPIVLVSFSSQAEQKAVEKFQRTLDALAQLRVHVIATTAGTIELSDLKIPANAVVWMYAAHDQLMERARLVISHGGHGTAMRSLRAGVPLLFMPGFAVDQSVVANACAELGLGLVIPGEKTSEEIRIAAESILGNPSYRSRALEVADSLRKFDGAAGAAIEIERILAEGRERPHSQEE